MPYLKMPNGEYFEVPEGTSKLQAIELAETKYPEAFGLPPRAEKRSLVKDIATEAGRGVATLGSQAYTGLATLLGDEEAAAKAGLERGKSISEYFGPSAIGTERVGKAYEAKGLTGAAGEVARQILPAVAGQAGTLATTAAGAAIGARLGSLASVPGALIGGIAGGALANLPTFFGGNVEEQAQEGMPINKLTAGAAAVGQSALEGAGTAVVLGKRLVSKLLRQDIAKMTGQEATEKLAKLANESLYKTVGKGVLKAEAAEIPVELGQDILQMAQAGMDLTSPEALSRLGETAYQTAIAVAPIGGGTRYLDRSAAGQELSRRDEEAAKLKAEQAAKFQAEYAATPLGQFDAIGAQIKEAEAKLDSLKGTKKDASKEEKDARNVQRQALQKQITQLTAEQDKIRSENEAFPKNRDESIEAYRQQEQERIAKGLGITPSIEGFGTSQRVGKSEQMLEMEQELAQYSKKKNLTPAERIRKSVVEAALSSARAEYGLLGATGVGAQRGTVVDDFGNIVPAGGRAAGGISPEYQDLYGRSEQFGRLRERMGEELSAADQLLRMQQSGIGGGYGFEDEYGNQYEDEQEAQRLREQEQDAYAAAGIGRPTSIATTGTTGPISISRSAQAVEFEQKRNSLLDAALEVFDQESRFIDEQQNTIPDTRKADVIAALRQKNDVNINRIAQGIGLAAIQEANSQRRVERNPDLSEGQQLSLMAQITDLINSRAGDLLKSRAPVKVTPPRPSPEMEKLSQYVQGNRTKLLALEKELAFAGQQRSQVEQALQGQPETMQNIQARQRADERYAEAQQARDALLQPYEASFNEYNALKNDYDSRMAEFKENKKAIEDSPAGVLRRDLDSLVRKFMAEPEQQIEEEFELGKQYKGEVRQDENPFANVYDESTLSPTLQRAKAMYEEDMLPSDLLPFLSRMVKAGGANLQGSERELDAVLNAVEEKGREAPEFLPRTNKKVEDSTVTDLQLPDVEKTSEGRYKVVTPENYTFAVEVNRDADEISYVLTGVPTGEVPAGTRKTVPIPKGAVSDLDAVTEAFSRSKTTRQKGIAFEKEVEPVKATQDELKLDSKKLEVSYADLYPKAADEEGFAGIGELKTLLKNMKEEFNRVTNGMMSKYGKEVLALSTDIRGIVDSVYNTYTPAALQTKQALQTSERLATNASEQARKAALEMLRPYMEPLQNQLASYTHRVQQFEAAGAPIPAEYRKSIEQITKDIAAIEANPTSVFGDKRLAAVKALNKDFEALRVEGMEADKLIESLQPKIEANEKLIAKQVEQIKQARKDAEGRYRTQVAGTANIVLPVNFKSVPAEKREAIIEKIKSGAIAPKVNMLFNETIARDAVYEMRYQIRRLERLIEKATQRSKKVRTETTTPKVSITDVRKEQSRLERIAALPTTKVSRTDEAYYDTLIEQIDGQIAEARAVKKAAEEVLDGTVAGEAAVRIKKLNAEAASPKKSISYRNKRLAKATGEALEKYKKQYAEEMPPFIERLAKIQAEIDAAQKQLDASSGDTAYQEAKDNVEKAAKELAALSAERTNTLALKEKARKTSEKEEPLPDENAGAPRATSITAAPIASKTQAAYKAAVADVAAARKRVADSEAAAKAVGLAINKKKKPPALAEALAALEAAEKELSLVVDEMFEAEPAIVELFKNGRGSTKQIVTYNNYIGAKDSVVRLKAQLARAKGKGAVKVQNALDKATASMKGWYVQLATGQTSPEGIAATKDNKAIERGVIRSGDSGTRTRPTPMKTGASKSESRQAGPVITIDTATKPMKPLTGYKLDIPKGGRRFSKYSGRDTGNGISLNAAQRVVDEFRQEFKGAPQIVVYNSPSDIGITEEENQNAKGMYQDGVVYLFSDNLNNAQDAALTLAHESVGHFGLRSLVKDGLNAMLDRAYTNAGIREVADQRMEDGLDRYEAIEEALAEAAELNSPVARGMVARVVEFLRNQLRKIGLFKSMTDNEVKQLLADARSLVKDGEPSPTSPSGERRFRAATTTIESGLVAGKRTLAQRTSGITRLGLRAAFVDRFAPLEKLGERLNPLKAMQMMYYYRMYGQRMNFVNEVANSGTLGITKKTRKNGADEFIVERKTNDSLRNVVEALKGAKAVGDFKAIDEAFTLWSAVKRADRVGFSALDFSGKNSEKELRARVAELEAMPNVKAAFEKANELYQKYNKGLLEFAADTGYLSKEDMAKLSATKDYIPYYRTNSKGDVILEIEGRAFKSIGNVNENPELAELKGGDDTILPFSESAIRNTTMLTEASLKNLANKNTAFTMQAAGMGNISTSGKRLSPKAIHFFDGGAMKTFTFTEDKVSDAEAELIVKGIEGVKVALPAGMTVLTTPARWLRKMVTRNPVYMARQLIRDSMSSYLMAGADSKPIFAALQMIRKGTDTETSKALRARGITGGQVLAGTPEDAKDIMNSLVTGKMDVASGLAWLDRLASRADIANREATYESYIKQGLSEMEATLMALEQANFTRQGYSPSLFMLAQTVPFMQSQITGLDTLYRALRGKMPFNEQLQIRKKLVQRGMMVAGMTLAYAALMQDDEAYKNATPEERMANWFVYTPFSSEPLRIPIPFEIGFITKAIPEALFNSAMGTEDDRRILQGLGKLMAQSIPGGTVPLPLAVKTLVETVMNKSFYTMGDIVPQNMQGLPAEEQYRSGTSELAKMVGSLVGVSPMKVDYVLRSLGASTGMALVSVLNPVLADATIPEPDGRASSMPLIGTLFQPINGRGVIENAYEIIDRVEGAKSAYDSVYERDPSKAAELLQRYNSEIKLASLAGSVRQRLGELSKQERLIKASLTIDGAEKQRLIDTLEQQKRALARQLIVSNERLN